ncbi:MAG: GAF domain-containing protein, partial [bacterium]
MRLSLQHLLTGDSKTSELAHLLEKREQELEDARARIRQLETALEARASEAAALRRIGEATGQIVKEEEILPVIAALAIQVTGTDSAQVYLFNDDRDTLILRAVADAEAENLIGKIRLKVGEGITGWVAREKQPVSIAAEAWNDERFKYVPELQEERYQSILSVPLIWRADCIGVINVRAQGPHEYTKTQIQLLSSIAGQIAGTLAASRQFRSAEKRALHLSTVAEVSKTITS